MTIPTITGRIIKKPIPIYIITGTGSIIRIPKD